MGRSSHCPGCAAKHAFSDGAFAEAPPTASPVGSKDDEIGFPIVGMQHDHTGRVAVLLDRPNRHACALGTLPQAGQQFEAFALVPGERHVGGHRVKDVEPRLAHTGNAERAVEGVTACLRQIDCAQDLLDRCHTENLLSGQPRRRVRFGAFFAGVSLTPSVHGGASLAGNESARI